MPPTYARIKFKNRPDVQYDMNGQHYSVEFDTRSVNGNKHQLQIHQNDPNTNVILKSVEP